jgi:prevent-host-death family protein
MKEPLIQSDVIPVGKLKADLAGYLDELRKNRRPLVITQNGSPAGVIISPEDYDKIRETARVLQSIDAGIKDADDGKLYTISQAKKFLKAKK